MSLYDKLLSVYPELANLSLREFDQYIVLQDDSDGQGAYIAKWEHPTLSKPTEDELK